MIIGLIACKTCKTPLILEKPEFCLVILPGGTIFLCVASEKKCLDPMTIYRLMMHAMLNDLMRGMYMKDARYISLTILIKGYKKFGV